ncbi:MAG: DUF4880 domain-containing protein [Verrucomicrobia bacterium]|nr:DUF4880 domain-containing protein [Verrucomicrobiota bacterium]
MNDTEYLQWVELGLRRTLTPAESERFEQWLAAHPEHREHWILDERLSTSLRSLPDRELSPRFTQRLLGRIEHEESIVRSGDAPVQPSLAWAWLRRWARPAALVVVLAAGGVTAVRSTQNRELADQARNAVWFAQLASLPAGSSVPAGSASGLTWLQDYDAISRLPSLNESGARADTELLALLK